MNAIWLGGAPGSGKTTAAKRLARRHGLRWYNADAHTWAHRDRALAAGHEAAHRWEAMTHEERWVTSTPQEMLELSLHLERGPMVVDDVAALPASPLVVAEGSTVMPRAVPDPAAGLWLLASPGLLRARAGGRPPYGLTLLIAEIVERDARAVGAPTLRVEAVDDSAAAVEEHFAAAIAAGPRAETTAERRALLRYENETVVEQLRAYAARPWTQLELADAVRTFVCECGDRDCEAEVDARVLDAESGPVLAAGHA